MQRQKFYRVNEQIQAREVRLLNGKGTQIGIVSREEALRQARELGTDVVEIAATAKPPVCRLVDFKKFLYQEEKRKKGERKKTHVSGTKEIRLGPFTSEHDLHVKISKARKFLGDGHKTKIVIKFTGRQMAHPKFGQKILQFFLDSIASISKIERQPHFEGRLLLALISPSKGGLDPRSPASPDEGEPVPPKQSQGGEIETENEKGNSKAV